LPRATRLQRYLQASLFRYVRRSFAFWERRGIHLTLTHHGSPIPDTQALSRDLFRKKTALVGIEMREREQLSLLETFRTSYRDEYERFPFAPEGLPRHAYYMRNIWFGALDASVYWCMIRHVRPRRIVEVGAGMSTFLSAEAVRLNAQEGSSADLVAIEPFPRDELVEGFPGLTRLIAEPVQGVPLELFTDLAENDILFIDSSHVLRIGSDVQYEILEILPRLRPGVFVHFHDILLPAEYHEEWILDNHTFWNEQYLLQAFLTFNDSFEVVWASSYLHHRHGPALQEAFSNYQGPRGRPSSLWIRRTR